MAESFTLDYRFDFANEVSKTMTVRLDPQTLALQADDPETLPYWTELAFQRCSVCRLDKSRHGRCPVAVNMAGVVAEFQDFFSFEEVTVTVTTAERSYVKATSLQFALSPLLGIIMVSSGCPTMEVLKPNVRFHLPFASVEETAYRSVTMYLLGQYYRQRRGEGADWSLEGLQALYDEVGAVNTAFAERLRVAARKDANINALVNLHCLGEMVPVSIPFLIDEMERYFVALAASGDGESDESPGNPAPG